MNQHLEQFALQIANWTEEVIEHGRTPFRRVDTFPEIATDQGLSKPPLVFWINRQSLMAGGIVLIPEADLEQELKRGKSCAEALGLKFFVTWETKQLRIWQIDNEAISETQSFPLVSPDQPQTFKLLLHDLLDSLKLLAVLQAVPPRELPATYFTNLFLVTLEQTLPAYVKLFRSRRSNLETESTVDIDLYAESMNRLTLLRILTLLWQELLPATLLPDHLEQCLVEQLPRLEGLLLSGLVCDKQDEIEIPADSCVHFHHLILRLRQVAWNNNEQRVADILCGLVQLWFPLTPEKTRQKHNEIYPLEPALGQKVGLVLSQSQLLLGCTALLRSINKLEPCQLKFAPVSELTTELSDTELTLANLNSPRNVVKTERQQLTMQLRYSWPSRRFKVSAGQPLWPWEALHLGGLCPPDRELRLSLPANLHQIPATHPFWETLCQYFTILHIDCGKDCPLQIHLQKTPGLAKKYPIQVAGRDYHLPVSDAPQQLYGQIALASQLPANAFELICAEFSWPENDRHSSCVPPGLDLYRKSDLYQLLSQLAGAAPENPATLSILPYPNPLLQQELAKTCQVQNGAHEGSTIDKLLADLIGKTDLLNIPAPSRTRMPSSALSQQQPTENLIDQALHQLEVQGIPNFPDQYLYFIEQPVLQKFRITPPVHFSNEILGQFDLHDAAGTIITGYGEELKIALQLCAEMDKTDFELPSDRQDLKVLLSHYQKDLEALHSSLSDFCYSQLEKSQAARKLVQRIWKQLKLPDLQLFIS